jgi:hypothetical protein
MPNRSWHPTAGFRIVSEPSFFCQEPAIEQVEYGEQKNRLMGPLVRAARVAAEIIKPLQPLLPCFLRRH